MSGKKIIKWSDSPMNGFWAAFCIYMKCFAVKYQAHQLSHQTVKLQEFAKVVDSDGHESHSLS